MKRFLLSAGVCAIAFAAGACGSNDSATAPRSLTLQLSPADSAALLVQESADATVADVNMINGISSTMNWDLASTTSGLAFSLVAASGPSFSQNPGSGCTYDATTGRFDCPPYVNNNGLTVTRTLAFFDANGVLMNHFDSTTASMNVQATDVGVAARANGADTVSRSRNLTATGLVGHNTTRTWNGTASGTGGGYGSDSVMTRTYDVSNNSIFSNIVVNLPRSANPYPASGTISRIVTGSGVVTKGDSTRTVVISRNVGITFNGTEFVPMMVGSVAYTLDLATGKATKN